MSLAAFAVLRTEGLLNGLMDLLRCVWKILVFLSEAAEIAIEGVGFALGRAVAQFGRGFEHGYHM
jgi:spore maturation protein SpmB